MLRHPRSGSMSAFRISQSIVSDWSKPGFFSFLFSSSRLAFRLSRLHEQFFPRNMWSLSNAFTSAFQELEPIRQMKAAASLAPFLAQFQ